MDNEREFVQNMQFRFGRYLLLAKEQEVVTISLSFRELVNLVDYLKLPTISELENQLEETERELRDARDEIEQLKDEQMSLEDELARRED